MTGTPFTIPNFSWILSELDPYCGHTVSPSTMLKEAVSKWHTMAYHSWALCIYIYFNITIYAKVPHASWDPATWPPWPIEDCLPVFCLVIFMDQVPFVNSLSSIFAQWLIERLQTSSSESTKGASKSSRHSNRASHHSHDRWAPKDLENWHTYRTYRTYPPKLDRLHTAILGSTSLADRTSQGSGGIDHWSPLMFSVFSVLCGATWSPTQSKKATMGAQRTCWSQLKVPNPQDMQKLGKKTASWYYDSWVLM